MEIKNEGQKPSSWFASHGLPPSSVLALSLTISVQVAPGNTAFMRMAFRRNSYAATPVIWATPAFTNEYSPCVGIGFEAISEVTLTTDYFFLTVFREETFPCHSIRVRTFHLTSCDLMYIKLTIYQSIEIFVVVEIRLSMKFLY